MKKSKGKLTLNKKTIAKLTGLQAEKVAGGDGAGWPFTWNTICVCGSPSIIGECEEETKGADCLKTLFVTCK